MRALLSRKLAAKRTEGRQEAGCGHWKGMNGCDLQGRVSRERGLENGTWMEREFSVWNSQGGGWALRSAPAERRRVFL